MRRPAIGSHRNFLETQNPGDRNNRDQRSRFIDESSSDQRTSVSEHEEPCGEYALEFDSLQDHQPNTDESGPPYEIVPSEDDRGPEYEIVSDDDLGPPYEIVPPEDDVAPPVEIDLPADERGPPYRIVPCFTPGTLISTPEGSRCVEDLVPGDKVLTRDRGVREICWVGRKNLKKEDLERNPELCPILVKRGALDYGLPFQNMVVSPNHRFLSSSAQTQLLFGEIEVLVAAKFLTILEGVEQVCPQDVSYIHLMFDRHELVLSQGVWTESFQPGDHSLSGMDEDQRQEILTLFPALNGKRDRGKKQFVAARRSLKKYESVALLHSARSFC